MNTMPDFANDYHDLGAILMADQSYTDFEGLADAYPYVKTILSEPNIKRRLAEDFYPSFPKNLIRDLVCHWLYENIDQADYYPDESEVEMFIDTTAYVLGSRLWRKVSDEDLA